ncbi:MAG: AraC family mar-sox-rob regulon transcriptional activator [Halieaceae bacterium]|jgi:AraC family mar-sox-rob regulon transcriptional activator
MTRWYDPTARPRTTHPAVRSAPAPVLTPESINAIRRGCLPDTAPGQRRDVHESSSLNTARPPASAMPPVPAVPPRPTPTSIDDAEPGYLPLSRTTDRVLRILLDADLSRVRGESVAEGLGISCTTLRRRLRNDHTSYQFLLDRARQYRCESRLRDHWLPGKCLAEELGYLEVNSFYRAFRRWTGLSYSAYKLAYH